MFDSYYSNLTDSNVGIVTDIHFFTREQRKKLAAVEMDLAAARQAGFVSKHSVKKEDDRSKKKLLAVIGIITTFGRKKNRDAIRKAWMPTGV